jgi:hypothetical protein
MTGLGLMVGAAALLWAFLPKGGQTHPLIGVGALSWIVPLAAMSLAALGLALLLNGVLRG